MRVLISTDTAGGVLTYTAELAAALEAAGEEVVVATMGPPLRRAQRARLPARVHESGFRLEWMEDPWEEVAAAGEWLLGIEAEEGPDVVHLCSYAHGALPFAAPKLLVAHSCVLSWWRAVHGAEAPASWDRYRGEVGAGLRGADAVVAPTRAMLAELERDHELRPGQAAVIHNGSAVALRRAAAARRPLVLGSGRFWDAAKNLAALDASAAGLDWPVLLAGELGEGEAPRHARGLGALDPPDLEALRREATVYAAPALYEPFGLGILEAAREGCALVLGDVPSLRELWSGAALFVDPRDPQMLRGALETLIGDPSLRGEMAGQARRRGAELPIEATAAAYRALYRRLLGGEAGRAGIPGGDRLAKEASL